MHTREPRLLKVTGPSLRPRPNAGGKRLPTFIDRQRLICVGDVWIQRDIVILIFILVEDLAEEARSSKGAHRVPNANESDRRACPPNLDVPEDAVPGGGTRAFTLLIAVIEVGDEKVMVFLNQAHFVH